QGGARPHLPSLSPLRKAMVAQGSAHLAPPTCTLNLCPSPPPTARSHPMAVYTEVDDDALEAFLAEYDVGELLSYKGIAEGVENTNYFLETDRGRFILTLYEKRVAPQDLPFFLGLMDHLAA